jgi:hypothetical protein
METMRLRLRKTNKFNDGWSCLEDWEDVGEVSLHRCSKTERNGNYTMRFLVVNDNHLAGDLSQAIRDTLSGSNCRHEFDCCGCASRSASVKRKNNVYKVTVTVTHNF